jgi:hypothetical protein
MTKEQLLKSSSPTNIKIDDQGDVVYIGHPANARALGSEALWAIEKIETVDTVSSLGLWAESSVAFNKVWDDRESYSYGGID